MGLSPAALSADEVAVNAARVRERIRRAGGDPERVRVIAVTKAFGTDVARAAVAAGLADLGENYAQELLTKVHDLEADPAPVGATPTWHFLGRLQTNKVRHLAPYVGLWQSVDRVDLVREIAARAAGAAVLVQINLSGEEQKGGCAFADAAGLVNAAREAGLDVRGLMGVAPFVPGAARPAFDKLVALADELGLSERSIGMSGDLDDAVAAGATMVRIGRDLFGERPPRSG